MVDCTLGEGGHSELFLERYPSLRIVGVDADPVMMERARGRLERFEDRVEFWNGPFDGFFAERRPPVGGYAAILFDFGISMFHFTGSRRGFSLQRDEALDMRLDERTGRSASDIVNGESERELVRIFRDYGEERFSGRIARAVVEERSRGAIDTSGRLADIVWHAVPRSTRYGSSHPATRVFQALRIAVNDELGRIERALPAAAEALAYGGCVGAISFHSLEDRLAKQAFRNMSFRGNSGPVPGEPILEDERTWCLEILTKKPVEPGDEEIGRNPASRSAKLRVARKRAREAPAGGSRRRASGNDAGEDLP
jgi:16S rRNA (cytosine1402-N4)-methyltransferase